MSKLNSMKTYDFTHDEYKCTAVSTELLTSSDEAELLQRNGGMVMTRNYGWFIKFYADWESFTRQVEDFSEETRNFFTQAWKAGYRMVELDCDAEIVESKEAKP